MNSQYYVDLNVCPSTPIPLKYTLQHFNLKGPVKECDDTFSVTTFNEQGKLVNEKSTYGLDDTYIYDAGGELIKIESDLFGIELVKNVIRDAGNRVIESSSKSSGNKFHYDSDGNFFEDYDIDANYVSERHFYDKLARVIKSEFYYPAINESAIKNYSYKMDGDFLVVDSHYKSSNTEKEPSTYSSYYKNGNYYGPTKNNNLEYDKYGNPLSYIDDKGNVSTAIKYKYFDGSSSEKKNSNENEVIKPQNPTADTTSYCASGDCINGWGKYQYEDDYYEGFWLNGKKSGYGFYKWEGIGKYIGNWNEDNMNGYGVYIADNNDNTIGNFSKGQLEGIGLTIFGDDWTYGVYSNGNLTTNYDFFTNNIDTGCVAGDCQDKYGRWKWSNGDTYTGFFENGKLVMGTYSFENGDRYTGTFNDDNQFHGTGRYFYKDGGYYGGEWSKGNMQGKGYYHNSDLEKQIGEWSNGSLVKSFKN